MPDQQSNVGQDTPPAPFDPVADVIASAFHDHYERLAPEFGYATRKASAKAWGEVPEQNRALMRATVRSLLDAGLIAVRRLGDPPDSLVPSGQKNPLA